MPIHVIFLVLFSQSILTVYFECLLCNPISLLITMQTKLHAYHACALFNIGKGSLCMASTSKRKFLTDHKYNFKEADQNINVILEVPFPYLLLLMLD